jgi:hypothetical protein
MYALNRSSSPNRSACAVRVSKRFARLSNGFSKKIDCHLAAANLHVAFYRQSSEPVGVLVASVSRGDLYEFGSAAQISAC